MNNCPVVEEQRARQTPFFHTGLRSFWLSRNLRYAVTYNPTERLFKAWFICAEHRATWLGAVVAEGKDFSELARNMRLRGHYPVSNDA